MGRRIKHNKGYTITSSAKRKTCYAKNNKKKAWENPFATINR